MEYRRVLVTGASGGVGAAFARRIVGQCDRLVLVGRNFAMLEALAEELGPAAIVAVCDLREPLALERLVDQFPDIDCLIHCAGVGTAGLTVDCGLQQQLEAIDVNCRATVFLCHTYAKRMQRAGRGAILNVSSLAGIFPLPNFNTYAASKAFMTSFSETLAWELKDSGIKVLTYCPGGIRTTFHSKAGLRNELVEDNARFLMSPEVAANQMVQLLSGGSRCYVPGILNKFIRLLAIFLPRRVFLSEGGKFYHRYLEARAQQ